MVHCYVIVAVSMQIKISICCVAGDGVVPHVYGVKSSHVLNSTGFRDVTFKSYNGLGHYTSPEEMADVRAWLTVRLGLEK